MTEQALSAQIRILPGGEHRLLKGIDDGSRVTLAEARKHHAYEGLTRAIETLGPEMTLAQVEAAGLRGRGGGGYPTAAKWRAARDAPAGRKVVVANLIGADPTALGDRALAEGTPQAIPLTAIA